MIGNMTSALMLVAPWPLLLVGLVAGIGADHHPRLMRRLTTSAAWFALICALLAAVAYGGGATQSETYLSLGLPARLGALAISVDVNVLTVIMLLLVAFVGMIVARYSDTYMEGDAHEGRFHRWLALTLGSFFTLIITGNMWGFWVSWVITSLCLHELLAFYRDRPGAVLAARKKYLLHRIADVSLLAAFVLVVHTLHTTQFSHLVAALTSLPGTLPGTLQVASGLIVLSAILKSAQFPTHGWLIQVMEAPTPVSALLHAGIIYTGAFLVLRTSPIISRVGWAGDTLVLVGLVSIVAASLIMMTITNIKGALAYSTCAQMGFMLMECGLGLYSIAVLHIIAHSVYKAHAFLSSGSIVEHFRAPALAAVSVAASLWRAILGLTVAFLVVIGIGAGFGVALPEQPALIVMAVILTVGMTQLLLQALNTRAVGMGGLLLRMGSLSALVCVAYFGLHAVFTHLLGPSVPAEPLRIDSVQKGLLVVIGIAFLGLLLIQQMLPRLAQRPFWRAVYVHFYNGLYADVLLTEIVRGFGPVGVPARPRILATDPSREVQP
ncbi:MAG: NADH-quinone oxidoreductase subunit L [Acidiferrobacter sp.]